MKCKFYVPGEDEPIAVLKMKPPTAGNVVTVGHWGKWKVTGALKRKEHVDVFVCKDPGKDDDG